MALSVYDYRPMTVFFAALAAVLGLVMGSFLHCAAWRAARGESFIKGRSRCPSCGHTLGAGELIPLFSWLVQRGRCRACGQRIPARYPLSELAFAVISVLCLMRFDLTVECARNYVFLCCLFFLTVTDLDAQIIPDGCHITAAAAWALTAAFVFTDWRQAGLHVLAAVVYGGGMLAVALVMDRVLGRDSMGGGDIKLIAVSGLYLGMIGTLFTVIIACFIGLLFYLLLKNRERGAAFPFGPSIAVSAALMLLYGGPLVGWYTALLT